MPYTDATYQKTKQGRSVTYTDEAGNKEVRTDGSRSWRNNNPGNIRYNDWAKNHGAIGKDADGFAIFPDDETGQQAKKDLLRGKYNDYDSIRQMLKGKFDKDGNYIPGTAYAPESDANNPDAYAEQIKKWTGLDVDNKKIKDLTPDEMNKLLDAMKRYEGWRPGSGNTMTPDGKMKPLSPKDIIPGANSNTCKQCHQSVITATTTRSPIALDINGDGIQTTNVKDGAYFDHDGNGFAEQTGWVSGDDGLLVMDRNGDGTIDNGKELFGSETLLANGTKATNGFQALSELDDNKDGKIDSNDAAYSQLKIWQDIDGDGVITYGVDENGQRTTDELKSLSDAGITSINTGYANTNITDPNGNTIKQTSAFTRTDGSEGNASDVYFQVDNMYTIANEWLDVPEDIAALPDLQGYGNVYDLQQAMVRDTSGTLKGLVEQFMNETDSEIRHSLITQILYKWTGVENVDPLSRAATKIYGNVIKNYARPHMSLWTGDIYKEMWFNTAKGNNIPKLAA